MVTISLGHVDEYVIEFLEFVIVPIAAEYVRHYLFTLVDFVHMHEHTHLSNMRHHQ